MGSAPIARRQGVSPIFRASLVQTGLRPPPLRSGGETPPLAPCYHSKVEAFLDREIAAHPGLVQIEYGWRMFVPPQLAKKKPKANKPTLIKTNTKASPKAAPKKAATPKKKVAA